MHGARYTAGTEFYLATGDIYATQQLLGHADIATTQIYTHVQSERLRRLVETAHPLARRK